MGYYKVCISIENRKCIIVHRLIDMRAYMPMNIISNSYIIFISHQSQEIYFFLSLENIEREQPSSPSALEMETRKRETNNKNITN